MNSPLTGKPMELYFEDAQIRYRGINCRYTRSWWKCEDTGEQFVTTEMDESHLRQIKQFWQSTRTPRRKEDKTEKILRDLRNKYQSWYQQATQSKIGRTPNFKYETELLTKIAAIKEIQNKLK